MWCEQAWLELGPWANRATETCRKKKKKELKALFLDFFPKVLTPLEVLWEDP